MAAAFAALGLAVLAAMAGGRWLRHALDFRWYRVAAPLAALLLSLYAGVTLASL